ncbi:DNA-binding response regulator [Thalassotalea euphylliae]|uniref:DNA-binding response regulator n=1 Tax=Thalassotalea euphylliae TaxID=1655234 RepID=A0A3E0TRJ4_9GAMM|nr:response regulator transcription factor [Thalassotalea euphylliae]REL26957.1 DNA-binding response regulator [Thalassotalea euphylliae]
MKILLIEDSQQIAEVIFDYFEAKGVVLDYAANGKHGLQLAQTEKFDCIILDLMLPSIDGISVCKALRADGDNTPIVMLTARDTHSDELLGFDVGADDYIVKPFDLALLEARINSLVRRHCGNGFNNEINQSGIRLDLKTYQVWRDNTEIKLNPSCFKILKLLLERAPNLVSRSEIEQMLWPEEPPEQDVLRKHIHQLRVKIDKPFAVDVIKTIPKLGYQISGET